MWTRDQEGATAVEYGILAAAVGIAFIVAGPLLLDAFTWFLDVVLDNTPGVQ